MNPRRLHLEALEARRVLSVIVGTITPMTVDEGDPVFIDVPFVDSSPGGTYTATARWEAGGVEGPAAVGLAPSGVNSQLRIRYDYSLDSTGFFTPERREILEIAGQLVAGRFTDQLTAITPSGNNTYTAQFLHPSTGNSIEIPNFSVGANELVVFVGARNQTGQNLATAGAGGGEARGTTAFVENVRTRGQLGAPDTDYAPWGGMISFDLDTNWHSELGAQGLENNESDFLSVALHELGHIFGFTDSNPSFSRFVSNGTFVGPEATAEYDDNGSPPLTPDGVHWRDGLEDNGQETALDPTVRRGRRKFYTELDYAALDDIGWQRNSRNVNGTVSDTFTYDDNGSFTGLVRVRNGGQSGSGTFQINVRNVAPTINSGPTITVGLGTPVQFTASFSDPGAGDTHFAEIAWGDGTPQEPLNVNQASNTASGQHVYPQPGTYTANVGVQDDDGATDTQTFTIVVTEPASGDWQNPSNRFDVNNDGNVAATDIILIVNEILRRDYSHPESGQLPPAPANVPVYLDVNADDFVAATDAIAVVNALIASQVVSPQGNRTRLAFSGVGQDANEEAGEEVNKLDEVFADFPMSWLDL